MRYLDHLVLEELSRSHRDPAVRKKAEELLKLLNDGKTSEPTDHIRYQPSS